MLHGYNGSNCEGTTNLSHDTKPKPFSIRRHIVFGGIMMGTLLFGIGGWAATAQLSGAVIAPGTVVVEKHVKKVQHRDGGIVSKINVKNGDSVEAGEIMIELDGTQIRAELGIIRSQLIELTARSVRLTAERDGQTEMAFPEGFLEKGTDAQKVAAGEIRLFDANRSNRQSQKKQLELQIEQLEEEIKGIEAQREGKRAQLELIERELEQVRELYKRKLTSITRVYSMEREAKRLGGDHGGLVAQIARARGKISEIGLQILAIDQTSRTEAQRELRLIEARMAELKEREIAAMDRRQRCALRAPQAGLVHELSVHTIGGVVVAAEPILLIVPETDDLTIEARFAPVDIDQVIVGRMAKMRFSAFSQKTTPELDGRVVHVSADVAIDEKSGQRHYIGRIKIDDASLTQLSDLKLLPGMPVEVFISTGDRTALSYLAKPLTDQIARAFRDE